MSFIGEANKGVTYAPGYFLAHEECERKTREIPQSMAVTTSKGDKYVPMGTIFPSNDADAEGIVYEDVDVTRGNMPGSVVTKGVVNMSLMPKESGAMIMTTVAKEALQAVGFTFVTDSSVTRPY